MTEATLFLPGLSPVGGKTITATFDGGKLSSNGGVLILREIERKLGLAAVLSRHIPDDRDHTRITHSYSDMTRAPPFWRQLARMGLELIDLFCARFERAPRCIVLDIDDTDDAVVDAGVILPRSAV